MAGDAMASLAGIFDKGGKSPPKSEPVEPDADDTATPEATEDGPNAAFTTAMSETGLGLDDEQTASLWRAIKACTEGY